MFRKCIIDQVIIDGSLERLIVCLKKERDTYGYRVK